MRCVCATLAGPVGVRWALLAASLAAASAARPAPLIGNLSVQDAANAADWSVQADLRPGASQYGDRAYTFRSVPALAAGAEWIRTANDSKAFTGATLASFSVAADADVYVALSDSISPRPAWLAGWADSGAELVNSEAPPRTFSLLRKAFPAGASVALGGNGNTSVGLYTVVVVKSAAPPVPGTGLESELLRLELSADPYGYRIVEKASGRELLSQARTLLTLGGDARAVVSVAETAVTADSLEARLRLSGGAEAARVRFTFTSPDVLQVLITADAGAPSNVTEEFRDRGERYYGLWQYHVGGGLDNRGADRPMLGFGRQPDTNFASARAPFYVTSRGYGVYVQTTAQGRYRVAVDGVTSASFNDRRLQYSVIHGSYANIFARYNQLAGGAAMPPLWAFDSIWWRDDHHRDWGANGVASAQQLVLKDADNLRANRIPAGALWIDRPYGTGTQGWGNLDFDSAFPDPARMVRELGARGMNLLLWITNRCANRLRSEGDDNGYLFSSTSWPAADLRKPAAYDWFKEKLDSFVRLGVRGYKIDRGEEGEMPDSVQNEMVTLYARLAKEGQDARHPGDNLIFARNVFDTGRRYVAVWNGDTRVSFGGLSGSVKNALRAGAINFPMWGSDIGGYASGTLTKELYARWFQFGAYSTMMEVLLGPNRTPWNDFDAELVAIARAQATAHHDLIPYTRSAVHAATQTGMPVMKQLLFEYPDDTGLFDTWDEYLFGPSLLVAPVVADGARSRRVYLPAGRWIDYNDRATVHVGPTTITAAAPLATIPLFARAGAVIPRGDILRSNNDWTPDWTPRLRIEAFPAPGAATRFDYFTGAAVRPIDGSMSGGTVEIRFGDLGIPGVLEIYVDGHGSVTRNGSVLTAGSDFRYDAARKRLTVPFSGATMLTTEGAGSLF